MWVVFADKDEFHWFSSKDLAERFADLCENCGYRPTVECFRW